MTDNEIEIRPDLKDIENTIVHLYQLGNYFSNNNRRRWSDLWYAKHRGGKSLEDVYALEDQEFAYAVQGLYSDGREVAGTLALELPLINYIDQFPQVHKYVERIESYQKGWIEKDLQMIDQVEQLVARHPDYPVDYWAIRQMIALHREQLEVLRGLDGDLAAIRQSERYRVESGTAGDDSHGANTSSVASRRSWFTKGRLLAAGSAAVLLVGVLANVFGIVPAAKGLWEGIYGKDDATLLLVKARAIPWIASVPDPRQHDQLFLQLQLRNVSTSTVLLTAAETQITGTTKVGIGVAGGSGQCLLSPDVRKNSPVQLAPGAEQWITVVPAIRLPGMERILSSRRFDTITVVPREAPLTILNPTHVERLNRAFEESYGADAAVRVILYSGNRDRIRSLRFELARGGDLHSNGDRLAYDALLAAWRVRNADLFLSTRNCD